MLGSSDLFSSLHLALNRVDLSYQLERGLRLRVLLLLEDLPARVRHAASSNALTGLGDRDVASVLVNHETPSGVSEHFRGDRATARMSENVDDEFWNTQIAADAG